MKNGVLFLSALMALLISAEAVAQEQVVPPKIWIGRWTGAAENSSYSAEAIIRIRPVSRESDSVTLSGTITMRPKSGEKPTILTLKGEQSGSAPAGFLTYSDAEGIKNIELGGRTDTANISYFISFQSGTFGPFEIRVFRTEDISGVWLFEDGNPMTVTQRDDGAYVGTYRGTAASGHGGLAGTLVGSFEEPGVWDGIIMITEGNVEVSGRFRMQLQLAEPLGPAFDETLEGTITASSNIDPVPRTNPIKLVRGER